MSINLNKNIFYLLFILTVNFIIISSYTEQFPFYDDNQRAIVNSVCKNGNIYCSMVSAIEDIFSSIQNEEIRAIDNDYCGILCIEYNNIYARDMICDDTLDYKYEDNKFEVIFNNCNVLIEGKIAYKNEDISAVNFDTFLSELKFKSINFYVPKGSNGEMEIKFIENIKKYNYNRKDAIFTSEVVNLTEQMDNLMDKVLDGFKKKINDTISTLGYGKILPGTLNHFQRKFTYFQGPGIKEEKKNVTYIYYSKFDFDSFVHINHKYFFSWMNVTFEYALNHNISYNVGYFIIDNFVFEENTENKNIYNGYGNKIATRYPEFNNDNNDDIWKTIINDFKDNLNKYRTNPDI